jgi:LmbE family N-acetylglucosaminyl deacetylase
VTPYQSFIDDFAAVMARARANPLGGFPAPPPPVLAADAPRVLIFSPHPDDEVIIGGLPLRLLRELRWPILDVAVTQGSNPARQQERWKELTECCRHIGFGLIQTAPGGLEGINLQTRASQPVRWNQSVARIAEILVEQRPRVIFFPHADDWNSTHIGTHHVVADSLALLGDEFACHTVETEFWGAMDDPNLLVESSQQDITDLITALSFHVGEVKRNPYHLRMPAWLMDNVRRGGELVGGQGGGVPDFLFGTLYRVRRWRAGRFEAVFRGGRCLSRSEHPGSLFAEA